MKRDSTRIYAICSPEIIQNKNEQELELDVKDFAHFLTKTNENINSFKLLLPDLEIFEKNLKNSISCNIHDDIKTIIQQWGNEISYTINHYAGPPYRIINSSFQSLVGKFYKPKQDYTDRFYLNDIKEIRPSWDNLEDPTTFAINLKEWIKKLRLNHYNCYNDSYNFKSDSQEFKEKISSLSRSQNLRAAIRANEFIIEKVGYYQNPQYQYWSTFKIIHTYTFLNWFAETCIVPKNIADTISKYIFHDSDFSKLDGLDIFQLPNFEKHWDNLLLTACNNGSRTLKHWQEYERIIQDHKDLDNTAGTNSGKKRQKLDRVQIL